MKNRRPLTHRICWNRFYALEREEMATTSYELPRSDAIRFLEDKLQLQNVSDWFAKDKRSLLDAIILKWHEFIPFHTLKQLSTDISERRAPTSKEAVNDVISGLGGLCGTHGVAAYHILGVLGYECHLAISQVMGSSLNHVAVCVNNVETPGDLFLFPVGTGYPSFAAVKLKTENGGYIEKSDTMTHSFLTYKYVKCGDTYKRYHLTSNDQDKRGRKYPSYVDDVWGEYYKVWLDPVSEDKVQEILSKNVYGNMDDKFNRILLASKYPRQEYLGIRQNYVMQESNKIVKEAEPENIDELKLQIVTHFPEIPEHVVERALTFWIKIKE